MAIETPSFKQHVQTEQHRVLAQPTSRLTLRVPQRSRAWGEDPLKLTFPEDPPYGSGLEESTTPQAKQFPLCLFALTRQALQETGGRQRSHQGMPSGAGWGLLGVQGPASTVVVRTQRVPDRRDRGYA